MKVRVATIGYGFLGKWHAQKAAALNELAELKYIVEKFPSAQQAARENHPGVKIVSEVKEILSDIDAAIIVTPTSFHYEVAKELLMAGKHVFCEKPLCSTVAEAQELEKLANEKKLVLQVGHSERCHQAWETLRQSFLNFKGPLSLRIDRFAPFKGRATDVDVVQDLMIHDIDLMLWLFGRKVKSVKAWGHKIRTQNWDHVTAEFTLADGMQAVLTMGRNSVHEARSLEVFHQSGSTRVNLFANKIQTAPSGEISPGVFVSESSYEKRDHLLIEQKAFYNSILQGAPVMVSGTEGRVAVVLVEAVLTALKSGQLETLDV
ncbi:MAG: Gfo/Idh/MocA family oxidoreductase [Bacteriovoracaceae bacterium]|nr:Gfo/Idh/MocA family oxidoreductase [Bacteriovoracaceae bacterium]